MLIAVCGSQGAGKSSVLSCLEQRGHKVVKHKTARSVLTEWSIDLDTIYSNPETTREFQNQLLERKWNDEKEMMFSDEIWFTERTFMDLFTYTVSHLGNKNAHSSWVDDYFERCKKYHSYYDSVFFIRGGVFTIQHDNVRPSNVHYMKMIDQFLNTYLESYTSRLYTIEFDGVEARADYIEQMVFD